MADRRKWKPDDAKAKAAAERAAAALRDVYASAAEDALNSLPSSEFSVSFDWVEPRSQDFARTRGAEMIGKKWIDGELVDNPNAQWAISETTRARTQELLEEAVDEGWSPQRFAERLTESGLYEEPRAETIARTEVGRAANLGQIGAYREVGADEVYVYDGEDDDDECKEANGSFWPIEDAEANPLEHPNCRRSFRPLTRAEREERAA